MDWRNVDEARSSFEVLQTSESSQTAVMDLAPGEASGEKINEHPRSEQVLYVIRGELLAEVGDDKHRLHEGDVVVVPRGVAHRFTNISDRRARTLNVYTPPAYGSGGVVHRGP